MMRVKELVQIEEVEEVVQITSHDPEKIVESFVAAENLEEQICLLLERFLKRTEKNSFFIIGSYGSGKSHLLSFLGDLFAYPHLWDKVKSEKIRSFAHQFREKRFIPIWIHLPSLQVDLRDYVLLEFEKQLSEQLKKPIALAPGVYFQTAEKDPRFLNFLRENLDKDNPLEAWEYQKSAHPEEALELARKFFNGLGIRPQIEEDVRSVMERALNILYDELGGETAIVLIIDELYDFLRGKESGSPEFARDIGFLRDLGEASRDYNFFVIASLQEDILDPEKTGAERENLNRIRQRYENLQIPYFNLQRVARERVLRKDDWQVEELRKLYSLLREKYFPSLAFDEASFVDLYPIHPAILYFYERVVREVGPRSIISFLSKSALQIQNEPHYTLVTIAELFDHLRDELSTHTTFGALIRDVFPYFQMHIPTWLEEEQEWAEKAIKALIILNIVGERRTCQQLAELILYRGIEDVNYQFFAKLMERLHQRASPYLYLAEGSGVNAVYVVQKEGVDVEVLINDEKSKIRDDDPRLWSEILKFLKEHREAPRELEVGKWCTVRVDWNNTERKGEMVFVAEEGKDYILEEAKTRLEDIDNDFVLLILSPNLPRDFLIPSEVPDERILIWRPGELGIEDIEILKRRLAILNLLRTGQKEEIWNELQRKAFTSQEEVERLVEDLYFTRGELSNLSAIRGNFMDALSESVKGLLNRRFTAHPSFNRKINIRMVRDTIGYLSGLRPQNQTLQNYADTFAIADLLVKESAGFYKANTNNEAYKLIINTLKETKFCPISDIYRKLRDKPYGLTEEVVEFIILSLVGEGIVSVKSITGKEFFRQNLRELMEIKFIDQNHALHLLEIPITPEILSFLKEIYGEVEIKKEQDKVDLWDRLQKLPNEFNIERLKEKIFNFHPPFNKDILIDKLDNLKMRIEPLFNILLEKDSPEDGFRALGEFIRKDYKSLIEDWRSFKSLKEISELQESINREIDYLFQVSLPKGDELLETVEVLLAELQGKAVEDVEYLRNWLGRVEFFKNNYIERYTALHEEMVGNSAPWWEKIKGLKSSDKLASLRELWEIRGEVGPSNPAQRIMDELYNLEKQRCSSFYKDSLRNNPTCPYCHFHPDKPPDFRSKLTKLENELEEEWRNIIEELNKEREKIMEQVQKATSMARQGIEKLLEGVPVQLSSEMKEVLMRAVGKLEIIEVDLRPYLKDGGIYIPYDLLDRIRKAVEEAIRGRKEDNIRIRLRLS